MVVAIYVCMAVDVLYFLSNALGPNPSSVSASPNGCQTLQVTWTHRTPTRTLTLNHYRVSYQTPGGSVQTVTTPSQGSYTLTGLAPATTYTVRVDAQTQLGYGYHCCVPTATTHNGEASSDVCMGSQGDCVPLLVLCHSNVSGIQYVCVPFLLVYI